MVNNREIVTLHLFPLPFDIQTRIFLVMIAVFLLGVLFGFLCYSKSLTSRFIANFKNKILIKKLKKQIGRQEI